MPPPPKGSRKLVYFLIAVAVVMGTIGTVVVQDRLQRRRELDLLENPPEWRQEVAQAFQGPPLAPEQVRGELQPLFDKLGAAYRARDRNLIMAHFDPDRTMDEFAAYLPRQALLQRDHLAGELGRGMGAALERQAVMLQWDNTEIRQAKFLQNGDAAVIARHHSTLHGGTLKMRWWLAKRQGAWKIYDLEDLDVGIRFSTLAGGLMHTDLGTLKGMQTALRDMQEAMTALVQQGDADLAEAKLRQSEHLRVPPVLEAIRHFVWGGLYLNRGQPAEALQRFEQSAALRADMPALDLMKAIAFNQLGQWDKALTHAKAYHDLLGDDAGLCREYGVALAGTGRFDEACVQYRKALDLNPKDADSFLNLIRAMGDKDARQDLGPRFAKLESPQLNFEICAQEAQQRRDAKTLEQLVAAMRKLDAKHPPMLYYAGLAKLLANQSAEAQPLLLQAFRAETNAVKRQNYLRSLLQAGVEGSTLAELYGLWPGVETFRQMAEVVQQFQIYSLEPLIEAHRRMHPTDAWIFLYEGVLQVQNGDYEQADQSFTRGFAKVGKQAVNERLFQSNCVTARFYADKALVAYQEFPEPISTFSQLFFLCRDHHQTDVLRDLIQLHRKALPQDPLLYEARWWLAIQEGKFDQALAAYRESLGNPKGQPNQPNQPNLQPSAMFFHDMVDAGRALDAYRGAVDAKQAFSILALDLVTQRRLSDARQLLAAHRQSHPNDPKLAEYAAEMLFAEQKWAEAAEAFAQVWKKAEPNDRYRLQSRWVNAQFKAGRGLDAYGGQMPRDQVFNQLVPLFRVAKQGVELEALVARHRPHAADEAQLNWIAAQAKALQKQPREAISLAQAAWAKDRAHPGPGIHQLLNFGAQMADAGFGLDAYRAELDPALVFNALAQHHVQHKKVQDLAELIAEHGKLHPSDARLAYFQGQLQLLQGDHAEAVKTLQEAKTKVSPDLTWAVQFALSQAQVKAGQAVQAYQEQGGTLRDFLNLANACVEAKDGKQLQALLDARRQDAPGDKRVNGWDIEVRWLLEDYAGVVKAYQNQEKKTLRGNRGMDDRHYLKSLVKLGQVDEAQREAEKLARRFPEHKTVLVLLPALRGDVDRTVAVASELQENGLRLESCYSDRDLGPLLRTDAFKPFRDRFPEPASSDDPFDPLGDD